MFRKLIKKLIDRKITSKEYISILKEKGIRIGEGTRFFDPDSTTIDTQNPHMLQIGENVRITKGCTILTHDYSWSVLAGVYGECLGGVATVTIGNNVFLGMNVTILKGTTIGDNVIIGAGSVVKGNIESDSVYAGIPAKKIMSLFDFYQKKKANYEQEARNCVDMYRREFGEFPKESVLKEYFWLFAERKDSIDKEYEGIMNRTGYYDKCKNAFFNSKPEFEGYDSFVASFIKND